MELPKTESELQTLINKAVEEAKNELTATYDGKFATQRKKYESQIAELEANKDKSAEEIAKQKVQQQYEADQAELAQLRSYKKTTEISKRLAKDNLPSYLVNDSRILNSSEEDFEKNYKLVKTDYESSQPKGNTHSSVVNTGGSAKPNGDSKGEAFEKMGECLKGLIG